MMSDFHKILASALIASMTGGVVGYYSAKEAAAVQVHRLEERQSNNFAEVMRSLADLKNDSQAIRVEIMNIIRERR